VAYGYENWFTGGGSFYNGPNDGFYGFSPGGGPKGGLIEDDVEVGLNPFVAGSPAWNAIHGVTNAVSTATTAATATTATVAGVKIPIGQILFLLVIGAVVLGVLRRTASGFETSNDRGGRRGSRKKTHTFNL
jgi:hypothetical protein